jgi:hypothetical protein
MIAYEKLNNSPPERKKHRNLIETEVELPRKLPQEICFIYPLSV